MGWTFSNCSRADLVGELTKPYDTQAVSRKTLAYTLRRENDYDVLWSVVQVTARQDVFDGLTAGQPVRFIRCDLINCNASQWGNKPLEEAMGPCYYSCPLSYLDMAPEQCHQWREKVRAYHAARFGQDAPRAAAHVQA